MKNSSPSSNSVGNYRRTANAWRPLVVLLAACIVSPRAALATENAPGTWAIFTTTDAFQTDDGASRWRYWFDAQARYFDLGSGINQYLVRPAIGYQIGDNLRGWVGYARFRSRNRVGNVTDENRYWQQLDWTAGRWNDGTITMRARLEQRSVSSGDDIGVVLRFSTKYVRPLDRARGTQLILALEPFVDLKDTDWGGNSGLGQNRLFVGVGWQLSDTTSLEAGYMNQYIWADSGEDRINHLALLNFKVKL